MNERIRELLVQAIKEVGPDDDDNGAKEKTLERFAELIVKECANIVNSLDQYEGQGDCSTAEYMKKCFGVE
jgi:hypothetical protein